MMGAKAVIVRDKMRPTVAQTCRKVLFPLFLSGWMVSCSPLNPSGWAQTYLDIAQLDQIANQRAVNLQGIVVNVAPFLEGGAYQIQDKTGKVWVKTDGALPRKGAVVSVRGEVAFEAIFIGPEKLGESYVIEGTTPRPASTASQTQSSPESETTAQTSGDRPPTATGETNQNPEITVIEAVEATATATGNKTSNTIEVVESSSTATVVAPETEINAPTSGAAALTLPISPPTQNSSAIQTLPIANPEAARPIAPPPSNETPAKPRLNVDDQFLPHKRLAK